MGSRYLEALNTKIGRTPYGAELSYLHAEKAAYLARLGEIEAARAQVEDLRSKHRGDANGRLTILINFADGLCLYYESMSLESRDRLNRAYALATATGHVDLAAKASAWLALLAYGAYDFDEMSKYISASVSASCENSVAGSRNALTIALAIHLANRFDLAQAWYQRARHLASTTEDDAMMSAILHNMASIWVTNIRNSELGEIETSDKSSVALLGVASTLNFDELIGSTSQPTFTPLARAQLLSVEGKCGEALEIYKGHLDRLTIDSSQGWQKWLLADQAWCLLNTGAANEALTQFNRVLGLLSDSDHIDDRAAALRRIAEGYKRMGLNDLALQCGYHADDCWLSFQRLQASIMKVTSGYSL